jgi:hypothetical protein
LEPPRIWSLPFNPTMIRIHLRSTQDSNPSSGPSYDSNTSSEPSRIGTLQMKLTMIYSANCNTSSELPRIWTLGFEPFQWNQQWFESIFGATQHSNQLD